MASTKAKAPRRKPLLDAAGQREVEHLLSVAERDGSAEVAAAARRMLAANRAHSPADMLSAFLDLCGLFIPKPRPRRV